jgi:hypothetical protein
MNRRMKMHHNSWLVDGVEDDGALIGRQATATEKHVTIVLERVDAHIAKLGWSEGYFSKLAAGDVNVVRRMRESGRVTAVKISQIEQFLDDLTDADGDDEEAITSCEVAK